MFRPCLLTVVGCCCALSARADVVTYSDVVPVQTTAWNLTATIPQFDPALGILDSVEYELSARIEGDVRYESLDSSASTVTIRFSGEVEMELIDPMSLVTAQPLQQFAFLATAYDGTIDFAGTSGGAIEGIVAEDTVGSTSMPPSAAELAALVGTGNVIFNVSAHGTSMGSGPGNLVISFSQRAGATVTVTYTYTPQDCFVDVDCDDSDACTIDTCTPSRECTYEPVNCDDDDACTDDSCDSLTGCVHEPIDCDDDDACTDDSCDSLTGCVNEPVDCDDNDACTDDSCDSLTGCVNEPIDCDDGLFCTGVETCDPVTGCESSGSPCDPDQTCDEVNDFCVDQGGGEGCTPGYWKQPHHFDSWVIYAPGDRFNVVFGVAAPGNKTLLESLQQGGGGYKALNRHAVAALLNSATGSVDYLYSTADVISLVQQAYATGEYEDIKDQLAAENEAGCPLN